MTDSTVEIHEIGLTRVIESLTARGYSVERSSSRETPDLQIMSPRGNKFWVNCRNVTQKGFTWFISRLDETTRPFYILTYAPVKSNIDPVEFWILDFDEAKQFVSSFGGSEPQGNDKRFREHYERWEKLPR